MNTLATPLVSLTDVDFGYGARAVVSGVNFEIHPAEFIGLIGPNGAGKSTLFKGLLGLLAPLRGTLYRSASLKRRIGYVPQRDTLDPIYPLTAWDVVRMGYADTLPWFRLPGAEGKKRIWECLEKVGMAAHAHHPFAQLSGGQRQRVLIARALAVDPVLLVLDEPTAGIDPVAEETVLTLLAGLHQQSKIALLMVSHHIQSLRGRVERVALVNNGRVVLGTAEAMLAPERLVHLLEEGL